MRSPVALSLILFLSTLILYLPALNSAFVNYDDPAYVTGNVHTLQGISLSNIGWAITATTEANWHPLTWISHMTDVQFFGTNPRGHHFVNVLLHALNVVLLFFILRKATGDALRSAVVAAVFAIHPLNVECVAWVAERKSLVSMLFLLLALLAYGWYASKRTLGRYLVVFAAFALGLASKPMVVTLPILLLLWDYWPSKRLASSAERLETNPITLPLVLEKIPLLALSAASSWITLHAQRTGGALGSTDLLPLGWRIENAIYSYVAYVGKGLWPSGLAVFYPHPEGTLAAWKVAVAGLLIVASTAVSWQYRNSRRYLLTGWLWYLVAMIPMIGIVQVGRQAMADRYAYLPFVGLFILAVWGCSDLFAYLKVSTFVRNAIAVAVLLGYASTAALQIHYWHNSYTLFSHALAVTNRNGLAEDNLGDALMQEGRPDLARPHFEAAIEYVPQLSTAHYNLGVLEQLQNHPAGAKRRYETALRYSIDPTETAQIHSNLGFCLIDLNNLTAAKEEFNAALQINSDKQNSLLGRGKVEYLQGYLDAAVNDLSHAARISPFGQADFWLGRALEDKGQVEAAATAYEAALQLAPGMVEAQQRLGALRGGAQSRQSGSGAMALQ